MNILESILLFGYFTSLVFNLLSTVFFMYKDYKINQLSIPCSLGLFGCSFIPVLNSFLTFIFIEAFVWIWKNK